MRVEFKELEMIEQIGAGAFGEIYKCRWRGTLVAAKCIKSAKTGSTWTKTTPNKVCCIDLFTSSWPCSILPPTSLQLYANYQFRLQRYPCRLACCTFSKNQDPWKIISR